MVVLLYKMTSATVVLGGDSVVVVVVAPNLLLGFCAWSLFYCAVLGVAYSFCCHLTGRRESWLLYFK